MIENIEIRKNLECIIKSENFINLQELYSSFVAYVNISSDGNISCLSTNSKSLKTES